MMKNTITMKRLLLISLCLLTVAGANAQQGTAKRNINLSAIDCDVVQTCSYTMKDDKQLFDGPISVKGGKTYNLEPYGHWGSVRGTTSYNLTATHSKGDLHGPIQMKYTCNVKAAGDLSDVRTITYKGNFTKSMPDGEFSLHIKANYMETAHIDVAYNNGVFTGPFRVKYQGWEWTDINGAFTNDGKMDGKWTISYRNRNNKSGSDTYHFQNGILVSGDLGPSDSKAKSLAIKYAEGKITKQELAKRGYYINRGTFCFFSNRTDLYRFVAEKLFGWDYINYDALGGVYWHANNAKEGYEYLSLVPYFTDEGFDAYVNSLLTSGWPIKPYEIIHLDNICLYNENMGLYYVEEHTYNTNKPIYGQIGGGWRTRENVYGYFLTEKQLEEFKSAVEKHNTSADAIFEELFKKSVLEKFKAGSRIEMADYQYYDVLACRVVKYHNRRDGMTAEIDCRRYGSDERTFQTYVCDIKATGNDPTFFTSTFTQCRNKWDDIEDIRRALLLEDEKIARVADLLIEEKKSNLYNEWVKQRQLYADFRNTNENIAVSHKDVGIVHDLYTRLLKTAQDYPLFLERYTDAMIAKHVLISENITSHIKVEIPAPADWCEGYDLEALNKVLENQKNLAAQWNLYKELRKKVNDTHGVITSENMAAEVVIDGYLKLYGDVTKLTMEESIQRLNQLVEMQESLLKPWPAYKELKKKAIENHNYIVAENMAAEVAINDYLAHYNDKTKLSLGEACDRYNRIIAQQEALQTPWPKYKELRKSVLDNHAKITSEGVTAEVVISDYLALYNDKSKFDIQSSCERLERILTSQKVVLEHWADYKALKNKSTENHTLITNDGIAAAVIISDYLTLYNTRVKGSIADSKARVVEIIAQQEKILELWAVYKELKKKVSENHDYITRENVAGNVVIDDYLHLYEDNVKTKVIVEVGIKKHNDILLFQENILKDWPTYKKLKSEVEGRHGSIYSENIGGEVVIDNYLNLYDNVVKTKLSVKESIKRYEVVAKTQNELLKQWPLYKDLKGKAVAKHNVITLENMAAEVIISDYLSVYNSKTKHTVEEAIKSYRDIINLQDYLLQLWSTYKKTKKVATEKHERIAAENMVAEVVIDNYLTLYNNNLKTKVIVEEGIRNYNDIIQLQDYMLQLWPTYKELKVGVTENHNRILAANISVEVVIDDYSKLYNDKTKLSIEDSCKRFNKIGEMQDALLKQWPTFKSLKTKAIDNHNAIINEDMTAEIVISDYLTIYNDKTRLTIEDATIRYTNILQLQDVLLKQWPTFKKLKKAIVENHKKITDEEIEAIVVITDYLHLYNDRTKYAIEQSIKRAQDINSQQTNLLELWSVYKDLKRRATDNHAVIRRENVASEVVIDDYLGMYENNAKTKAIVEVGITKFNTIVKYQENLLNHWPTYKKLLAEATDNHRQIISAKMSDDIAIEGYISSYENRLQMKLSVEESNKRLSNIIEMQKHLLKSWPTFKELKQHAISRHQQIVATKSVFIKEYVALYTQIIKMKVSVDSEIEALKKLVETQNEVIEYISLTSDILDNNESIASQFKKVKSVDKIYQTFFKEIDFTWRAGGNMFDTAKRVLAAQKELLKLSKRTLSEEKEDKLKKMKFKSLEEFVRYYKNL